MSNNMANYAEIAPDLSRPSLAGLSYVLRHPETWPEGFQWYYGRRDMCAMGLAMKLWPKIKDARIEIIVKWMPMDLFFAGRIFLCLPCLLDVSCDQITPIHVADAIDAYLAGRVS